MSLREDFEAARQALLANKQAAAESLPSLPPAPNNIEETGLRASFLVELAAKLLLLRGNLTGREICDALGLPYAGVVEVVLAELKGQMLAGIGRGESVSELDWEFRITDRGTAYARDLVSRNGYAGVAPLPLDRFVASASEQLPDWQKLNAELMRESFEGLVVSEQMLFKLGPAFNSGKSLFLYGHAGNGKTLMSERMGDSLRGGILIPHAIEAGGQVVLLYDPTHHERLGDPADATRMSLDRRWILIRRPFIIVGGELLMQDLEMAWNDQGSHYIAPLQLKANGGVFMIDDFGRQQMPARQLLNRWIVPLEKNYDYHYLSGGVQMQVPFNLLIIFSTNLAPKDLVEEAFLRRIRYKVEVGDPSEEQFRQIFVNFCGQVGLEYRRDMLDYLIDKHYRQANRGFRATHPRDLLSQLMDIARFNELPVELSCELLDAAVATYFVDLS